MYKIHADFVYYIELNGEVFASQPFETYEARMSISWKVVCTTKESGR